MTSMSQLGEKGFLRALIPTLRVDANFVNGFGHDASIIDLGLDQDIAFKIDRAPFPVALRRGIGDYRAWGRLAVVANVSDLLAVGATPRAVMLSLVLPGDFDADHARAIISGCEEACATHEVAFLGGDTKEGAAAQVIGAALGTVEKGAAFGRGCAAPGDRLFLAGEVGAFAGTLALMDASGSESIFPEQWCDVLLYPAARKAEGLYLRNSRRVAAACDLSDGLANALSIFCRNGVGITVDEAALPMHAHALQASRLDGGPLWRFALGVGDWALACVVREQDASGFQGDAPDGLVLQEIGRFNASGRRVVMQPSGVEHEIPEVINEQFRKRLEDDGNYLRDLLRLR